MIEATQKKLREVRYFLSLLEQEAHASGSPREPVEFLLSAFVSAARSVTFVLEAERGETYAEWSLKWRATRTDEERKLLSRFTEARNRAVKRQTPLIQEGQRLQHVQSAGLPPELMFFFFEDEEDKPSLLSPRILLSRLRADETAEEILPLCRSYESILSALVSDFIAHHSA